MAPNYAVEFEDSDQRCVLRSDTVEELKKEIVIYESGKEVERSVVDNLGDNLRHLRF